ncbi:MAG TPA: spherulation-specific family 4 protein [Isosphaeraceae bacterium]|nr:spherulation-specific family 4 protein [Isosphaeraceae bacterium]
MCRIGPVRPRIVLAGMGLAVFLAAPHSRPARASSTSVLVPAYVYPAGAGRAVWDQLAASARSITLEVIVNPASGPGRARDPNYVAAVDRLRAVGGRVLGYVHTSYGKRPLAAVEQDVRSYLQFYGVDGFFIDEMANTPQALGYYESLYRSIKRLNPSFKVVGNPGTPYTLPDYLKAVDTLVIFEGSAAAYAEYRPMGPAPWVANHPPGRFANLVYAVHDAKAMHQALGEARKTNAGSVFITNDTLPNPYRGLPSYWTEELAAVAALDVPRPPPASARDSQTAPAESIPTGSTAPGAVVASATTGVSPAIFVPQSVLQPRRLRRLLLGLHPFCRPVVALQFRGFTGSGRAVARLAGRGRREPAPISVDPLELASGLLRRHFSELLRCRVPGSVSSFQPVAGEQVPCTETTGWAGYPGRAEPN